MAFAKFFSGRRRVAIFATLMVGLFIILLPTTIKVASNAFLLGTGHDVQIDTVSYVSNGGLGGQSRLIVGNLYHPLYNLSKRCPAIIACHGFVGGIGKERISRWAVELAKREYVVLCIDMAGHGSSVGNNIVFASNVTEPYFIQEGIAYLKTLSFVNASAIGLLGHSYGGSAVCFAAGVLGNLVNATVALSPITNCTDWMINDLLPVKLKIPTSQIIVHADSIETGLAADQASALVNFLTLYRGSNILLDYLFLPDTATLNRTTLRHFDAVEVLPEARPDSMMFIQGTQDELFYATNQSGQGHRATPYATFIEVEDNHALSLGLLADYAMINFFDEKLKGVVLTDLGTDNQTYTQHRDIQLTIPRILDASLQLEILGVWITAAILIGIIMSLFVYEKRSKRWRIIEDHAQFPKIDAGEDPSPEKIKRVRHPTYPSVFLHLSFVLVIFYGMFTLGSTGFVSPQFTGTFLIGFYVATYLAIRNLPNDSELQECHLEVGRNDTRKQGIPLQKKNLGIIFALVAGSGAIGAILTGDIRANPNPGTVLFRVLFFTGLALVVTAFGFLFREKKQNGKAFTWEQYHLSRPRLVRGFALGIILFTNIAALWQFMALFLKLPFPIAPHTPDYLFGLLGFVLFALGIEVWVECILRSRFPMDGLSRKERIHPRSQHLGLGCIVIFLVSLIAFLPISVTILNPLGSHLATLYPALGPLFALGILLVPLLIVGAFLIIRGANVFSAERDATFTATFYPLLIFWFLAFFLHV